MKAKKQQFSNFEEQYKAYLSGKKEVEAKLTAWVHGELTQYPYQAVEDFLQTYARADELSRRIEVQALAMECLAECFGSMAELDARLFAQARRELQPDNL